MDKLEKDLRKIWPDCHIDLQTVPIGYDPDLIYYQAGCLSMLRRLFLTDERKKVFSKIIVMHSKKPFIVTYTTNFLPDFWKNPILRSLTANIVIDGITKPMDQSDWLTLQSMIDYLTQKPAGLPGNPQQREMKWYYDIAFFSVYWFGEKTLKEAKKEFIERHKVSSKAFDQAISRRRKKHGTEPKR